MFKRFTAAALLAALAVPAGAVTVDLEGAVGHALEADPRISEREHLVDVARALLQEATGSDDLFLDLNMFLAIAPEADGFYTNGRNSCINLPCTLANDGDEIDGLSPWADLKFKLIKPLLTFGKIESYTEAAQGNVDVKRGDVRLQRVQTRMQVTRAYYGYLTARDSRQLIEDLLSRVDKAEQQMQAAMDEGRGTVKLSDFYALQAGAGFLRKGHSQAEAIEATALAGLRLLTGIVEPEPLEVADRHIRPVPLPSPEQSLVEAKKAEQRPNVYVGIVGSAAYASERDRLDNPQIYDPFNHVGATPMVGMQWHWAGGVQSARIAQAEAELNALVEKQSFARLGIPFEVAERYNKVKAGRQAVDDMAEASRAGRRFMLAAYADFEAGSERMDRVIEAFRTYALAHTDYLTTINDYNVEVFELQRVAGVYE